MSSDTSYLLRLNEGKSLVEKCDLLKDAILKQNRNRSCIKRNIKNIVEFKSYVDEILCRQEYDILLKDDSFFQFERNMRGDQVVYKYVFMQNPLIKISFDDYCKKYQIDLEYEDIDCIKDIYNEDESEEVCKMLNFPLYIRYDVDDRGYIPNLHSYSHLHIGVSEDIRIPVSKILTPPAFVNLVIKMVYPSNWKHIISASLNDSKIYDFKRLCEKLPDKFWNSCELRDVFLT